MGNKTNIKAKTSDYKNNWLNIFNTAVRSGVYGPEVVLHDSNTDRELHKIVERILTHNEKTSGIYVADIGCGTGRYFDALKDLGLTVFGFDYSLLMLRKAKSDNYSYLSVSDAEQLPIKNNVFDIVLCISVLQTLPCYNDAIKEMHRITKPGGIMILSTLRKPCIWELVFYPLSLLIVNDKSLMQGKWYPRLIKDRQGLLWYNRPEKYQARRFEEAELSAILYSIGFTITGKYYFGKIRKLPMLFNSQFVTYTAFKNK